MLNSWAQTIKCSSSSLPHSSIKTLTSVFSKYHFELFSSSIIYTNYVIFPCSIAFCIPWEACSNNFLDRGLRASCSSLTTLIATNTLNGYVVWGRAATTQEEWETYTPRIINLEESIFGMRNSGGTAGGFCIMDTARFRARLAWAFIAGHKFIKSGPIIPSPRWLHSLSSDLRLSS